MKTKRLLSLVLCFIAIVVMAACGNASNNGNEGVGESPGATDQASGDGAIYVEIDVKDYGVIVVKLDPTQAPKTVENFVNLVNSGFYDGLTFHRIMAGFMIQGGDPLGNGTGGSDTQITGEFSENGIENNISHVRGVISMARANDFNSASSQFFIVHQDATGLDGKYAGFGYVVEGMDVVDRIATEAQPVDRNGTIPANEQPIITSMKVINYE